MKYEYPEKLYQLVEISVLGLCLLTFVAIRFSAG